MEKLLTIDDVCQLLGVAKQTVYCWISEKRITVIKIGNRVRFRSKDIEEFVEDRVVPHRDYD